MKDFKTALRELEEYYGRKLTPSEYSELSSKYSETFEHRSNDGRFVINEDKRLING